LPLRQRTAIVGRFYCGWDDETIAIALDARPATGTSPAALARWAGRLYVAACVIVLAWALLGKVIPSLFPDGARVARLRHGLRSADELDHRVQLIERSVDVPRADLTEARVAAASERPKYCCTSAATEARAWPALGCARSFVSARGSPAWPRRTTARWS